MTSTLEIPMDVRMMGKFWATTFMESCPNWSKDMDEYDEWNSYGGYDLNLYVCEGQIMVTVYALEDDGTGLTTTNTECYTTVFQDQSREL